MTVAEKSDDQHLEFSTSEAAIARMKRDIPNAVSALCVIFVGPTPARIFHVGFVLLQHGMSSFYVQHFSRPLSCIHCHVYSLSPMTLDEPDTAHHTLPASYNQDRPIKRQRQRR